MTMHNILFCMEMLSVSSMPQILDELNVDWDWERKLILVIYKQINLALIEMTPKAAQKNHPFSVSKDVIVHYITFSSCWYANEVRFYWSYT